MKYNFRNSLFINFGGIGDEILFLPTLSSFKKSYPESKITLALEPRSKCIKDLSEIIDETITVDIKASGIKKYFNILKFIIEIRKKKFDCVISSGKSPFIAIILFLTGIKFRAGYNSKTDFLLTQKVTLNENQYAGKMYHDLIAPVTQIKYENPKINIDNSIILDDALKNKNYIAIHPGVSKMSIQKNILKCPNVTFWNNLITDLLNKNKNIVLLGTKDDKDLIEELLLNDEIKNNSGFINFYNKTKNIMEMALIMKNAESVICVDSAPLHVAVGVGARIFAIFGPTNEQKLVPDDADIEIITNNIDCRPCLWHKRMFNCEKSECLDINYKIISDKIN